jgi:uncharacterized membrane protein YdbT with pleckstrin-like domain
MSLANQNLVANEHVVVKARLHPAVFAYPVLGIVFGVLILPPTPPANTVDMTSLTRPLVFLFILFCVWALAQMAVLYLTTDLAVTNQRIIGKRGLLQRHSLDVLLRKVESVEVHQGLVERLLGFGTIVITGSGGTRQRFPGIGDPLTLRAAINNQIAYIEEVQHTGRG